MSKKFEEHVIRVARIEFSDLFKENKEEIKIDRISNKKQKRKTSTTNKVRMDSNCITMSIINTYYEKLKLNGIQ